MISSPPGFVNLQLDRKQLGVTGRQFQQLKRATFAAMGREWHGRYLELHFEDSAMDRYGYVRRKPRYLKRKQKRSGSQRPLVFSGEGLRLSRLLDLRVTAGEGRVVLPRKFNFKNPKSRVDMRAELTKVLQPEADEISQVGMTALGRELDTILAK